MTRALSGRALSSAVVLLTCLTLSACSGDPRGDEPAPDGSPVSESSTSTPTRSAAPDVDDGDTTPGVPEPGSMERPATSSGPLTRASFPTPRELGGGWAYAIDPGDAEEGYAGNGTPALARNPQEIVQTAVPFGCPRRTAMPVPTHALEVDYRHRGAKAIAVRGRFADASTAKTFFEARAANLRSCQGRSGSEAIGPLVAGLAEPATDSFVSTRTPRSDAWTELSVLDGDTVVLLAVHRGDFLAGRETRRLVTLFRR